MPLLLNSLQESWSCLKQNQDSQKSLRSRAASVPWPGLFLSRNGASALHEQILRQLWILHQSPQRTGCSQLVAWKNRLRKGDVPKLARATVQRLFPGGHAVKVRKSQVWVWTTLIAWSLRHPAPPFIRSHRNPSAAHPVWIPLPGWRNQKVYYHSVRTCAYLGKNLYFSHPSILNLNGERAVKVKAGTSEKPML